MSKLTNMSAEQEIQNKERFGFGKNWSSFLKTLTEERIITAENSIKEMLKVNDLNGKSFIDIGSGSGLFSLAARRLGASVFSFDYDIESYNCTKKLKEIYFPDDPEWNIKNESVLDDSFISMLDKYDVVYSWGVLHHTGDMWKALDNVSRLVKSNGFLFIALYNDQGHKSKRWYKVKKMYNSGLSGRLIIKAIYLPYFFIMSIINSILKRKNLFKEYKKFRGMSVYHDWIDWLGGFPFEVASVDDVVEFYLKRGFYLFKVKTNLGLGNNHFVLKKFE